MLAAVPLYCRHIAVKAGHSREYWSTISANYMLAPERWIFGIGVSAFIIIHLSINGLISSRLLTKASSNIQAYAMTLEMCILGIFLLIAWIPAHLILGMHALLGAMLFCSVTIWMNTILQHARLSLMVHYATLLCTGVNMACLCAMIIYIPTELIGELVRSGNNIHRKLQLLGMDERWTNFAIAEWLFFYSTLLFMQLCN